MDYKLRNELIIHGFIKESQKSLPKDVTYFIIPKLVIHTCSSFYFVMDKFDPEYHGENME